MDVRIMGLDIGTKRIGVALSDELGFTAQPLETVRVEAGKKVHLDRIAAICVDRGVESIVAGIPIMLDGTSGGMARRVRKIIAQVEAATGMPVLEVDERLTSRQAERALSHARVPTRDRKKMVDQVAASLILQTHLDTLRRQA